MESNHYGVAFKYFPEVHVRFFHPHEIIDLIMMIQMRFQNVFAPNVTDFAFFKLYTSYFIKGKFVCVYLHCITTS